MDDRAIQVGVWLAATLIGTVVVALSIAKDWIGLRDPELSGSVFTTILKWEMAKHALRIVMEMFSWFVLYIAVTAPPPAVPPPVTTTGVAGVWGLIGFRVFFTIKNLLDFGQNISLRQAAERRKQAQRRLALRKATLAAAAGGIAPEPEQERIPPRVV